MEDNLKVFKTGLIGRMEESRQMRELMEKSESGSGFTLFVSGEAGIGKTRLVEEILKDAGSRDTKVLRGWCQANNLEPLLPVKEALRSSGLNHLIEESPPPKVISTYLIDRSGILITKAERSKTDLDPDIFASMLRAVENFVGDSLNMMGEAEGTGLRAITFKEYSILMEAKNEVTLALVIKGPQNEFLIDDMKRILTDICKTFHSWDGSQKEADRLRPTLSWFVDSNKYDGKYLTDDPKLKRENYFDNILLGLQRESLEYPMVLFLDDLQWADPSTLSLLHYISRNTRNYPLAIIGTFRPEDIISDGDGDVHILRRKLQDMNRENLYREIELRRMEKDEVKELVVKLLHRADIPKLLYRKLHTESEGNPFFLLEIIRLLLEEEYIIQKDGTWSLGRPLEELNIPSRIHDLVTRRLDRLIEEQRELLECASVIGNEFESNVVQTVTGQNRIRLLKNLAYIEKTHRLIHSVEKKYRFDHTKVREVLYNNINVELREEYHRVVAESYESLYREKTERILDILAYHFHMASHERAVPYLIQAATISKEKYANEEAENLYELALEHIAPDDNGFQITINRMLGDIHLLMGDYPRAISEHERALDLVTDTSSRAMLYGKLTEAYTKMGDYTKALEEVNKGLEIAPQKDSARCILLNQKGWIRLRQDDVEDAMELFREELEVASALEDNKEISQAYHNLGTATYGSNKYHEALAFFERAMEIRTSISDLKGTSASMNNIGVIYAGKGEPEKALRYYQKSLEIREKMGDSSGTASSLNNLGVTYTDLGKNELAMETYYKSLRIREKIGDKRGIATTLNNIGDLYWSGGDPAKALDYFSRSLEIWNGLDEKRGTALCLNNIGAIHADRGDFETALEYNEHALDNYKEAGDFQGVAMSLTDIGYIHLLEGTMERAVEYFNECVGIISDIGYYRMLCHPLVGLAEALILMEDLDTAIEKADKALEVSVETGTKIGVGKAHRVLGMAKRMAGDYNHAEEEFKISSDVFEEIVDNREKAITTYEYARLLLERYGEKEASELIDGLSKEFESQGMLWWVKRCGMLLESLEKP